MDYLLRKQADGCSLASNSLSDPTFSSIFTLLTLIFLFTLFIFSLIFFSFSLSTFSCHLLFPFLLYFVNSFSLHFTLGFTIHLFPLTHSTFSIYFLLSLALLSVCLSSIIILVYFLHSYSTFSLLLHNNYQSIYHSTSSLFYCITFSPLSPNFSLYFVYPLTRPISSPLSHSTFSLFFTLFAVSDLSFYFFTLLSLSASHHFALSSLKTWTNFTLKLIYIR